MRTKVRCLCCGYRTLDERGGHEICPVCFWEDDTYLKLEQIDEDGNAKIAFMSNNCDNDEYDGEDILDIPSGANHSLTLRQGRVNYCEFGACEKEMLEYCRKPSKLELK